MSKVFKGITRFIIALLHCSVSYIVCEIHEAYNYKKQVTVSVLILHFECSCAWWWPTVLNERSFSTLKSITNMLCNTMEQQRSSRLSPTSLKITALYCIVFSFIERIENHCFPANYNSISRSQNCHSHVQWQSMYSILHQNAGSDQISA